jgi:hypothetical protein
MSPFCLSLTHRKGTIINGMSTLMLATRAVEALEVPGVPDTFARLPGASGLGAFPEGIDQSPAFATFLFDLNWVPSAGLGRGAAGRAVVAALQR